MLFFERTNSNSIKIDVFVLHALNSVKNFKSQKWFLWINTRIKYQNMVFLKATLNFIKWNTKTCLYFCKKSPKCLNSMKNHSSIPSALKSNKIQVIDAVLIKTKPHIIHWSIFPFFPKLFINNKKSRKLSNNHQNWY